MILIFVIYDGISNSVFHGQVLQPIINKIKTNPELKVLLISFEKSIHKKKKFLR